MNVRPCVFVFVDVMVWLSKDNIVVGLFACYHGFCRFTWLVFLYDLYDNPGFERSLFVAGMAVFKQSVTYFARCRVSGRMKSKLLDPSHKSFGSGTARAPGVFLLTRTTL